MGGVLDHAPMLPVMASVAKVYVTGSAISVTAGTVLFRWYR